MPERDRSLPIPEPSPATIFKRLMLGKQTLRTREAYAADLREFARFLGIENYQDDHPLAAVPDQAWQQLDTGHVAAYLAQLKQTVSPKTGQPYSTATIARRLTAVREFLTEATYLGLYPRERLLYLKERLATPAVTHQHHPGITPDEQTRLLAVADAQPGLRGQRDYALFRLWLDTGLRRAEMTGLQGRDLIIKEGIPTLVVRHGKGNRLREIGLESYTAHVVRQWLVASAQADEPYHPMFCQLRKTGRGDLEIMPAACLLQRHCWRQAAQSLPRGGCLLVTNPRLPDQAELFQTLKRFLQARGRTVLLWPLESNQATIS